MAQDYKRTDKVGDFLQRELAQLIQQEMRDPRVGMVNINAVEVSRDLSHAKVYVTFVNKNEGAEIKAAVDALNGAAGYLRSKIAKIHAMRITPKLRFIFDESIARGDYLSRLIDEVSAKEDAKHSDDSDQE